MARSLVRSSVLLLAAILPLAPPARAADVVRVPSRLLGHDVRARVLLPPSYAGSPERRYPVLYFLHDAQGGEGELESRGVAGVLTGRMRRREMPEMLVVSPRAAGSWYIDSHDGRTPYLSFLGKELVPWIDATYRTLDKREARAVAGISMGGYGAFRWALAEPERFAWAGGLSPALLQNSWGSVMFLPYLLRAPMLRAYGSDPARNSLRANDLYDILLSDPSLAARSPRLVVRCGLEDKYLLAPIARFFDRYLDAMGVAHDLVLEPGDHDWAYWSRAFPELAAGVPFPG